MDVGHDKVDGTDASSVYMVMKAVPPVLLEILMKPIRWRNLPSGIQISLEENEP